MREVRGATAKLEIYISRGKKNAILGNHKESNNIAETYSRNIHARNWG